MLPYIHLSLLAIMLPFLGVSQSLNIPLIEVAESSVSYSAVDEIHFTINLYDHAKEITEVSKQNKETAQAIFQYLKSKGIPENYIQTRRISIARNVIRNRHPIEYDGYNASQQIYVCLKNISLFDEIFDHILQMDVNSITGPDYKTSRYEELLNEAKIKALKKARKSAENMAGALGQSIGKAKLVKTSTQNSYSKDFYSSQTAESQPIGVDPSIATGEIQIKASVIVSFELL